MSSAHPVCNSHGICKPLLSGRKASSCPPACPLLNRRARRRTPPFQSLHAACKAGGVGNSSTTRQEDQALVIGAGIAGLSCGLRLHKAGIPFSILEASDGVGGRVRSDKLQGFTLDRGFQIFLTSYPEAKAALDYAELDLKPFYAGALVHYNKKFHKVADPLRHPLDGALSLFSTDTGSVKDKVTVGAVRLKSQVGSVDRILQRNEITTLDRLKAEGFSNAIIDRFFRPFLGGIFFDNDLQVTSRLFEFVMRMLAEGQNSLPSQGIGAVADQLAAALPAGSIQTGVTVKSVTSSGNQSPAEVTLGDGTKLTSSRGIVVAANQEQAERLLGKALDVSASKKGKARGTCNVYFKTKQKPPHGNVLYLNGEGSGLVNNACFPSAVAPSYAPSGQEPPTDLVRSVQLGGRLYVCGDHRDTATLDGALKSGRRAAEALIADTVQDSTVGYTPSQPAAVDQTELA